MLAKIIYWLPRLILVIYFALLGFFSFHVEGGISIKNLIPIFTYSLPVMGVIFVIIISLQREQIGAVVFAILGAMYTIICKSYLNIELFFLVSLPLFLASILFYANYLKNKLK